ALGKFFRAGGGLAAARLLPAAGILEVFGQTPSHEQLNREPPPFPEFKSPDLEQKVLVIPLREDGEPQLAVKLEDALDEVTSSVESDSYGKLKFKFTLLPEQITNLPNDRDQQDVVAHIGDALATNLGQDLSEYQTRLYVLRSDSNPKYGGIAFSPIEGNRYKRATVYVDDKASDFESVAKHELGHTLGMPHANSINASGKKTEYGGLDDPMGATREVAIGYNAPQRVSMGWIGREQVQSVAQSGIYFLDSLDYANPDKTDLTRVLRIQKPDTNERYYISFRPQGSILGGVNIHTWNEKLKTSPDEVLVPEAMRKGWKDGDEYYDKKNGIRIRQISIAGPVSYNPPEEVQLQITFDK
ncbi:MAG TPA: hypothetical protein VLG67_04935, partial [Candidatus Saccharimonadales bacterium]|nr:hypothetical protein [Candidatus Saccharimonadales bacterium]